MLRTGLLRTLIRADFFYGLPLIGYLFLFAFNNPCYPEEKALPVGEKLVFNMYWKFVKVGYGTLEIKDIVDFKGRKAYHIYSEAKSAPFFDTFFKVRDTNESWIDVENFYSLGFEQKISEGTYKRERITHYDQQKHTAMNKKGEIFEIPEKVMDALAALYWVRTQELKPNEALMVNVNANKGNYKMIVKVHDREKIKVNGKEYSTIVVEPDLRDAGIFVQKGAVKIWLTDDEKHKPVKLISKISVGSITGELETEDENVKH